MLAIVSLPVWHLAHSKQILRPQSRWWVAAAVLRKQVNQYHQISPASLQEARIPLYALGQSK
jgi:hypothetical protein